MQTERGHVVVFGQSVLSKKLLDSPEPNMIMIKDGFGDPMILLVRILSDDTWGLCTKGDADWNDMLVKYGFKDLAPGTSIVDVVNDGISSHIS